jgi:hypothetical protein
VNQSFPLLELDFPQHGYAQTPRRGLAGCLPGLNLVKRVGLQARLTNTACGPRARRAVTATSRQWPNRRSLQRHQRGERHGPVSSFGIRRPYRAGPWRGGPIPFAHSTETCVLVVVRQFDPTAERKGVTGGLRTSDGAEGAHALDAQGTRPGRAAGAVRRRPVGSDVVGTRWVHDEGGHASSEIAEASWRDRPDRRCGRRTRGLLSVLRRTRVARVSQVDTPDPLSWSGWRRWRPLVMSPRRRSVTVSYRTGTGGVAMPPGGS